MNAPSLEERMDNLEKIVEPLRELPDRVTKVEEQIVQLRTEMRGEFSAIRRDMATKEDLAGMRRRRTWRDSRRRTTWEFRDEGRNADAARRSCGAPESPW